MLVGLELRKYIEEKGPIGRGEKWGIISIIAFMVYAVLKLEYKTFPNSTIIHLFIGIFTIIFAFSILNLLLCFEDKTKQFMCNKALIDKVVKNLSQLTLYIYLCQQLINYTIVDYFNELRFPLSMVVYVAVVFIFSMATLKLDDFIRDVMKK